MLFRSHAHLDDHRRVAHPRRVEHLDALRYLARVRAHRATIVGSAITNIVGNGFSVTYDATQSANSALAGKTYTLRNGGTLTPQ